jgi:mRNA-degrading endonuclease YafQ of YafQ-DinJ toxin-antitoxin module
MEEGRRLWDVKITTKAGQDMARMLKDGVLTEDDQIVIRQWAQSIIDFGPESIRVEGSIWKDHELSGEWAGHRASSFSTRGRIIYKIEGQLVRVLVVRVTAIHDYEEEKKS